MKQTQGQYIMQGVCAAAQRRKLKPMRDALRRVGGMEGPRRRMQAMTLAMQQSAVQLRALLQRLSQLSWEEERGA